MKKLIITIISVFTLLVSCEVNDSLNIDQKSPTTVPAGGLFANATRNYFDLINDVNVNRNVRFLYAQYWAQTTYPDESQYNQVTRNIGGNIWNAMYRDVLQDLKGAKETIVAEGGDTNQEAIIAVMEVFAYGTLVETFGDVPYSESLDPLNPSPSYDDDEAIYLDLLNKLDAAITAMDASGSGFEAAQDPVYGGDVGLWKKAANTLKLRMAMRIADSNAGVSKQMAESAASSSAGLITDNADNFGIKYLAAAPNTNPLWVNLVQSGRDDFVGANTMIDYMNPVNDPRLPFYFTTIDGIYDGGTYGSANAASGFSSIGDLLKDPALQGNIMTAAEVHFLLAEAAARTYSVGGTAEDYYEGGIVTSILEYGGSQADADTYVAQGAVAYATAAGDWKQKIATQKWIAMYNTGMEGWTTYRIFDQPALNAVEGMSISDIPTRFTYPVSEQTLNGASWTAGSSAIGGDNQTTKLFFDKF